MNAPNIAKQHHQQIQRAIALHQSGSLDEAARIYESLLKIYPGFVFLQASLGVILLQQQDYQRAARLFESSLIGSPNDPLLLVNYGIALTHLNRPEAALKSYEKATAIRPDFVDAHFNAGHVLQTMKLYDQAISSYDKVIALQDQHIGAYCNRGLALKELGRLEDALESIDRAIEIAPEFPEAYYNRALIEQQLNRHEDALSDLTQAIALNSRYVSAYINYGIVLKALGRYKDALAAFRSAIELDNTNAEAHYNAATVLRLTNRFDEALACVDQAILIKPDFAEAYCVRGKIMSRLDFYDEAFDCFEKALKYDSEFCDIYIARGTLLHDLKKYDEALEDFNKVLALNEDHAEAYWNMAHIEILLGEYSSGWLHYEWRWKCSSFKKFSKKNISALWLGDQPIDGKTLFIWREQGLGDFIQFCRYVLLAEERGASVILEVPLSLISLVETSFGNIRIHPEGAASPESEFHCPLMSLPLAFKTTVTTVPNTVPYLRADVVKRKHWQQALGSKTALRIGVVWAGSRTHSNDHKRSIPLALMSPLFQLPFEFHVLQKDVGKDEAAHLQEISNLRVHADDLTDFSDTAALVMEMDLIISVDTSVAHLAGALGQSVWLLLPYAPDYRWLLDRTDSPWYPTMTLFRQPTIDAWPTVVDQVVESLRQFPVDRVPA